MEMRKGFVYTLEAVIASSLILLMVTVVLPESAPELDPELSSVESGLETLESNSSLKENITPENLEKKISRYIPGDFNYSSRIYKSKNSYYSVNAPDEIYINESGNSADVQLWISSPSDLNISFKGEKILENVDNSGYYEKPLSDTKGWLNITGSGSVNVSTNIYTEYGESPPRDEIFTKNLLTYSKKNREVQVHLWR